MEMAMTMRLATVKRDDFQLLMTGAPQDMVQADILTETECLTLLEMLSQLAKIQTAAVARLEQHRG